MPLKTGFTIHNTYMYSILQVAGTPCVAVSRSVTEDTPYLIEFWKYPQISSEPFYTYRRPPQFSSSITEMDGKLLVNNPVQSIIEEFDVSSIPIKKTGLEIPTYDMGYDIRAFCGMKHNGENRLLLQYFLSYTRNIESAIKCIDYAGQELWHIKKQPLGGIIFQPWDMCTDHRGHVFTLELKRNRVAVINPDQSLEVLTTAPGQVTAIGWCGTTRKLYIGYQNERGTQMMVSRFNITTA